MIFDGFLDSNASHIVFVQYVFHVFYVFHELTKEIKQQQMSLFIKRNKVERTVREGCLQRKIL